MFASLRSNVISVLCSKDFWLGWQEMTLAGEKDIGTGEIIPKYVKKTNFKTNTGIVLHPGFDPNF